MAAWPPTTCRWTTSPASGPSTTSAATSSTTAQGHPRVVIRKPQGAFYVIIRLPVKDVEHFAVWLLSDFSLDGRTVMIAPAPGFYSTPSLGTDEARIAYVVNEHDLREAIRVFKAGLEKYRAVHG